MVPKEDSPDPVHPLKAWRQQQLVRPAAWPAPARSMTIAEAAARGNWAPQLWHDWESGRRIPTRANMLAVCEISGLEPNDFYLVDGVPFGEWRRRHMQ